ncbi:MAG: hypothetical protein E5Y77_32615 [Mesorhizobium sp.]|nr:MAG: hypothetical protein E5Y77_32615 [Mesorhizobium sp.]
MRPGIRALCSDPSHPPLSCRTSPPLGATLGGDWPSSMISPRTSLAKRTLSAKLPISPLVGEMSGRTEGALSLGDQRLLHRSSAPR